MSQYLDLGLICEHCGLAIESKPDLSPRTMVVSGFEPMMHKHVHNKQEGCVVTTSGSAKPYSDCGNSKLHREIIK